MSKPPALSKVLVTGADGYIGSVLVPYLTKRGFDVTALDTGYYRDGLLYHTVERQVPTITRDIRQVTEKDLQGFDALVHLAELSNDPAGDLNPQITYAINHEGSVHLANLGKRAGVRRFVYTSSCSVYGVASGEVHEESPVNPQTAYAVCKTRVERDLKPMASQDFSPVFLRNATAFGASSRMRFDLVLNNLSGLAWTTKKIQMTSDGSPWRPLVHILDIAQAIACCLEAPKDAIHNQIYNVGSTEQNYQVKEIATLVAQAFPGCELIFGTQGSDNRSYRASSKRFRKDCPAFGVYGTRKAAPGS